MRICCIQQHYVCVCAYAWLYACRNVRKRDDDRVIEWHIKCIHFVALFLYFGNTYFFFMPPSSSSAVRFIFSSSTEEFVIDRDQNMVEKYRPKVPVHMITQMPILWLIFICKRLRLHLIGARMCVCVLRACIYISISCHLRVLKAACRCCLWIILDGLRACVCACMFDCDMIKWQAVWYIVYITVATDAVSAIAAAATACLLDISF